MAGVFACVVNVLFLVTGVSLEISAFLCFTVCGLILAFALVIFFFVIQTEFFKVMTHLR